MNKRVLMTQQIKNVGRNFKSRLLRQGYSEKITDEVWVWYTKN